MNIYEHFRSEERPFVDQVIDWKKCAEVYHESKLTDFLDPREQYIVTTIVGQHGEVRVGFFGGNEGSERKRALLSPAYIEEVDLDYGLQVIELEYATKFHEITHPQVLGTLMSIGLKRQKYGDIVISEKRVQLIVADEIAAFVELNLEVIGKAKVKAKRVSLEELRTIPTNWQENVGIVASLRLDVIVAQLFHLSRQKAQTIIKSGLVKVNHKVIEYTDFECKEDDLFSARGYGRGKILSIDGKTKRDKWKIVYGLQKS